VVGEFLAPIPGQGPIEFAWQLPGLFDQGGDDALGNRALRDEPCPRRVADVGAILTMG
jgi:hypothetical protein